MRRRWPLRHRRVLRHPVGTRRAKLLRLALQVRRLGLLELPRPCPGPCGPRLYARRCGAPPSRRCNADQSSCNCQSNDVRWPRPATTCDGRAWVAASPSPAPPPAHSFDTTSLLVGVGATTGVVALVGLSYAAGKRVGGLSVNVGAELTAPTGPPQQPTGYDMRPNEAATQPATQPTTTRPDSSMPAVAGERVASPLESVA